MKKGESTKSIKALKELNETVFKVLIGGVYRRMTIPELNKELGRPQAVLVYNKFEAKTGRVAFPFIKVERYADGKLRYNKDVVIRGIKKSLIVLTDYSGITTEYVRKDNYDPGKMPKATIAEVDKYEREILKKSRG